MWHLSGDPGGDLITQLFFATAEDAKTFAALLMSLREGHISG